MQCFTLLDHCWFRRMLVIAAKCLRKRLEDFMTSIDFYAFHRFAGLQSWAFFWKLTVKQYFKSLAKKSNPQEPPFLHIFFSAYIILRKWEFLLNFFSFRLADDEKSFNAACKNIILHFFAAIMDFFILFEMLSFLSSNNTPGRVSPCQIQSLLDMYFK